MNYESILMEQKNNNISLEDLISEVLNESEIERLINNHKKIDIDSLSNNDIKTNIFQLSEKMLLNSVVEKYNQLKKELTITSEEKEFYQSILKIKRTEEYQKYKNIIREEIRSKINRRKYLWLFIISNLLLAIFAISINNLILCIGLFFASFIGLFSLIVVSSENSENRSASEEAILKILNKKYGDIKYSNIKLMLVLFEMTSQSQEHLKERVTELMGDPKNFKELTVSQLSEMINKSYFI